MSSHTLGIPGVDLDLERRLQERLEEVEGALMDATQGEFPLVTEAAQHLLRAGGKRFRPMLVLLASELGDDPDADGVVASALVVELTHVATLYHDDVMDEAYMRRGAPSANDRWGNSVSILVGDFLFARASDIVADLGPDAVRLQARTFSRLVHGQIRETQGPGGGDALQHYLRVVADKTGSLIATSALFGATMAGAPVGVRAAMCDYGERIGACFQLADDIIDVASSDADLGKAQGTDLREGVPTLPTLLALASTDPADARLKSLLGRPLTHDAEHAEALALLRGHPAIGQARAYVQERADEARALLDAVPSGPARRALESLCDAVVTRST